MFKNIFHSMQDMTLQFGTPIESMGPKYDEIDLNAKVVDDASLQALERIIKDAGGFVACEIKEDGFRAQAHVTGKKLQLFTRQLTEFETECLPEIAESIRALKLRDTILDAELIGAGGKYNGYKAVQSRARYKGRISEEGIEKYFAEGKVSEFPLELIVFDLMMHNGRTFLDYPYAKRRELVEKIGNKNPRIKPSVCHFVSSPAGIIEVYKKKVLAEKCEGLVLKQPNLPYIPGDKEHWIKLKKFEPVDLVVVGLFKNTQKESPEYSQAMVATYHAGADVYQTVGVVNLLRKNEITGRMFAQDVNDNIAELLEIKPLNVEYGKTLPEVYVAPEKSVVLEIGAMNFDYGSSNFACRLAGEKSYSLRIAYVRTIRDDKVPRQASTTEKIAQLHRMQK